MYSNPVRSCGLQIVPQGTRLLLLVFSGIYWIITGCTTDSITADPVFAENQPAAEGVLDIDFDNLPDYARQPVPAYITEDNTRDNSITDIGATLGRILFYDKNLSVDNSIACASCHQQSHAFGDPSQGSAGVNGFTQRQSIRLVNARFSEEDAFFWDERANRLEDQIMVPIQDHTEMGFSGQDGDPDLDDLFERLAGTSYYPDLFSRVYGDPEITENRIERAMAQFIRSIQSFDSKYDAGRSEVNSNTVAFPNFTDQENFGKNLFMDRANIDNNGNRTGGGLSCNRCHRAPAFDIDPDSRNNGVITSDAMPNLVDLSVTRSPSLRDLFNRAGILNTPLMHTGDFVTIDQVIDHYNDIDEAGNNNLDRRLSQGDGVNLRITQAERAALIAFLKTLTGNNIYEDPRWGDPFLDN